MRALTAAEVARDDSDSKGVSTRVIQPPGRARRRAGGSPRRPPRRWSGRPQAPLAWRTGILTRCRLRSPGLRTTKEYVAGHLNSGLQIGSGFRVGLAWARAVTRMQRQL